jgi:hypothetical protein
MRRYVDENSLLAPLKNHFNRRKVLNISDENEISRRPPPLSENLTRPETDVPEKSKPEVTKSRDEVANGSEGCKLNINKLYPLIVLTSTLNKKFFLNGARSFRLLAVLLTPAELLSTRGRHLRSPDYLPGPKLSLTYYGHNLFMFGKTRGYFECS